jgi:hypothetical protein
MQPVARATREVTRVSQVMTSDSSAPRCRNRGYPGSDLDFLCGGRIENRDLTPDNGSWRRTGRGRPAPTWGHLQVLERIGGGAFGDVYRAFDPRLGREVALKVLRASVPTVELQARVMRESRNLARVQHPNVVAVHGAQAGVRRTGFWMELVRGTTLAQFFERRVGSRRRRRRSSAASCAAPSRPYTTRAWCTATSRRRTSCAKPAAASC